MLIKLSKGVISRHFKDVCYMENLIHHTDILLDNIGSEFTRKITHKPIDSNVVLQELYSIFYNTESRIIDNDFYELLQNLESADFIITGNKAEELNEKDEEFSYDLYYKQTLDDRHSPKLSNVETRYALAEYCKKKPTLLSFQIEIASKCNERCIHCYIPHETKNDLIDEQTFDKIIRELNDMGTMHLSLSGGEPMMNPLFPKYLEKLLNCDFAVTILSNLTLLNQDIINIMKRFRHIAVQVSVYSMKPEIHDAITKLPGSLSKTLEAIENLIENNIPVQVSCPAMKINKDCYIDVLDWCKKKRIKAHSDFIIMAKSDRTTDNLSQRLSLEDTRAFIKDIIYNDDNYQALLGGKDTDYTLIKNNTDPEGLVCSVGLSSASMDAKGNVVPCAGWNSMQCGNIHNQSLKDIWENSPTLKMLRGIRNKSFPKCLTCEDHPYCSFCMSRNSNENPDGDIFRLTPHTCEVARINREEAEEWKKKHQH